MRLVAEKQKNDPVTVDKVFITPDMALDLLKKNRRNRPLSDSHVEKLVREMRDGRWFLTNQGIGLSKKGEVIDGQHRLHAIARSGIGQWFFVTHGQDEASFTVIDQGTPRSTAALLAIERPGTKNLSNIAAGANQMLGGLNQPPAFPKKELLDFTCEHLDLLKSVVGILGSGPMSDELRRAGVVAAFCNAIRKKDDMPGGHGCRPKNQVLALAERLANQMWKNDGDPMKTLSFKFQRERKDQQRKREVVRPWILYSQTVTAIRSGLAGRDLNRIEGTTVDWGDENDR